VLPKRAVTQLATAAISVPKAGIEAMPFGACRISFRSSPKRRRTQGMGRTAVDIDVFGFSVDFDFSAGGLQSMCPKSASIR
jgi:hypothetical protein